MDWVIVRHHERGKCMDIQVSLDVLREPEALPLVLRNIVVLMSDYIPDDDNWKTTFREFMKVVCELDRSFKSLHDD